MQKKTRSEASALILGILSVCHAKAWLFFLLAFKSSLSELRRTRNLSQKSSFLDENQI